MKKKKSLWPYAIVLVFVLFAAFIISFVVRTMQTNVELVSNDYYSQELVFQSEIDKTQRTQALGDAFDVSYIQSDKSVNFSFPDTLSLKEGKVKFYRPSDSKMDFEVALGTQPNQTMDLSEINSGLWLVKIDFSSNSDVNYYFEKEIFID